MFRLSHPSFLAPASTAALLAFAPAPLFPQELRATLAVETTLETGDTVPVEFTLANESDQDLRVLKWNTPLEGVLGNIFRVEREGTPVPYEGVLIKRGDPVAEDYVDIAAGASVKAEVDLAKSYDLSEAGAYDVQFLSPKVSQVSPKTARVVSKRQALRPVRMPSTAAAFRVEKSTTRVPRRRKETLAQKSTVIEDCSDTQRTVVESANTSAALKATFVSSKLNGMSASEAQADTLLDTWFGTYTSARFSKVRGNYQAIETAFNKEEVTYHCGGTHCSSSTIAYVFSGGANEVFLCTLWFSQPTTGTDTQYGTLIHELSHEAASTDDHAYGYSTCKNLATNNPDDAVDNADNYQFYAEEWKLHIGVPKAVYLSVLLSALLAWALVRRYRAVRRRATV